MPSTGWLDATGRVGDIEAINAAHVITRVGFVTGAAGTPLVPAYLLDEADEGQAFAEWGGILRSLPEATDEPAPPEPTIP